MTTIPRDIPNTQCKHISHRPLAQLLSSIIITLSNLLRDKCTCPVSVQRWPVCVQRVRFTPFGICWGHSILNYNHIHKHLLCKQCTDYIYSEECQWIHLCIALYCLMRVEVSIWSSVPVIILYSQLLFNKVSTILTIVFQLFLLWQKKDPWSEMKICEVLWIKLYI